MLAEVNSGISLDEQQRRIEGRCLEQGWTLAELFVEGGVSGSVPFAKRPQRSRLTVCCGATSSSARKLDRCFRSALDALETINTFRQRGTPVAPRPGW
jgi:hypothetical protein